MQRPKLFSALSGAVRARFPVLGASAQAIIAFPPTLDRVAMVAAVLTNLGCKAGA